MLTKIIHLFCRYFLSHLSIMSSSPNMDDDTWNERSATEKQQIAEAVQMIKHFKQLEVNSSYTNIISSCNNPIRLAATRSE